MSVYFITCAQAVIDLVPVLGNVRRLVEGDAQSI